MMRRGQSTSGLLRNGGLPSRGGLLGNGGLLRNGGLLVNGSLPVNGNLLRNGSLPDGCGRVVCVTPRRALRSHLLAGVILLFGLLGGQAFATDLASDIAGLLDRPAAERAFWGIKVIDVESGEAVYEYNPNQLFVPASNTKLFSTALALASLGPDYRFVTSVVSDARVDSAGVLTGDIILLGGGDPNLSSRLVPYNYLRPFDRDLMQPITDLARQIAAAGVVRVTGDVIGDDSRYVRQSTGVGWAADDGTWGYGAPISALSFNDNLIKLRVMPGSAMGQLARVDVRPGFAYYSIENRVRTSASRSVAQGLQVHRDPGSRTVTLWGEISIRSTGRELELAVDEPALFAAAALRSELLRLGVEVRGEARARHAYPHQFDSLKEAPLSKAPVHTTTLARLESRPLADILKVINKVSQNLHAEMLLREAGYLRRGVGSFDAGLLELKTFLLSAGLKGWEFKLLDASGLSRQNLATPTGMAQLLHHMWASAHKEAYAQSLPLAGEDGTLNWRFSKSPARGRIRAKTGTLTGVTALSGYATAADGRVLAFAIFVNNFGVPASYIRRLVDQVCERLVTAPLPAPLPGAPVSGTAPVLGTAR